MTEHKIVTGLKEAIEHAKAAPSCQKCGRPLTTIEGFWPAFETPHCMPCLLDTAAEE